MGEQAFNRKDGPEARVLLDREVQIQFSTNPGKDITDPTKQQEGFSW